MLHSTFSLSIRVIPLLFNISLSIFVSLVLFLPFIFPSFITFLCTAFFPHFVFICLLLLLLGRKNNFTQISIGSFISFFSKKTTTPTYVINSKLKTSSLDKVIQNGKFEVTSQSPSEEIVYIKNQLRDLLFHTNMRKSIVIELFITKNP